MAGNPKPLTLTSSVRHQRNVYSKGSPPPNSTARIEACIFRAHRQLSIARDEASNLSDLGLHDDLQLMLGELERFQVSLLGPGKPVRLRDGRYGPQERDADPK
jgi:hypothetical protein